MRRDKVALDSSIVLFWLVSVQRHVLEDDILALVVESAEGTLVVDKAGWLLKTRINYLLI